MLTVQAVAEQCGLSGKAIYRAIDRGELKAFRLCSRLRVRRDDMESWIEGARIEPDLPAGRTERRHVAYPASNGLRTLVSSTRENPT
jgi:excisionase family DNA binding protein